ncbi:hypothetical protein QPK24_07205 [Paenibacillus polygoni]|uniref:Extracellular solute-binding protein n=1 Tax=Paenibacillus polygoni TaxID=3050112 RepID=A0ABY8X8K0_9BACL|nr:hypothetical protein [Paenibacillus polygoni]WIV20468.1 hypothetical protein QPK24_07205 [Paenibacillus polygoni]
MANRSRWALVALLFMVLLTACGKEEDTAFRIFMTDDQGSIASIEEELQSKLQEKYGDRIKIEVISSPIYNQQKLLLEYVGKANDLMIMPENDMKAYGSQGSHIELEDTFNPETYSRGFFKGGTYEIDENGDMSKDMVMGDHLFGIPLDEMKIFQELNYPAKNLFATIPVSTSDIALAKEVLKFMTELN